MKKHLLVTLATKDYINQAKQLFSSAYWNGGWDGDFMLLSHNIPEKDLKWFRKKGILIYKCKSLYKKSKIKENKFIKPEWSIILLNKFYLFAPYFKKWENIIYLDTDILIKASLKNLKNLNGFYAPLDILMNLREDFIKKQFIIDKDDKFIFKKLEKNFNLNVKSFNAGVFAFNTDIINNDTFYNLNKLFKEYKDLSLYGDQGIFNLFFYKKWKELPLVYDFYGKLSKKNEKIKFVIMHTIREKPWEKDSPYFSEWKENLDKSDLIDIKNPINKIKKLTDKEIKKYSSIIKKRIYKKVIKENFYKPLKEINRRIGQFGIFLENINPKTYHFLKKLKGDKV